MKTKKRMYLGSADELLAGKLVICDMAGKCDAKPCRGSGAIPQEYNPTEHFGECCWPGKTGLSVPIDDVPGLKEHIVYFYHKEGI